MARYDYLHPALSRYSLRIVLSDPNPFPNAAKLRTHLREKAVSSARVCRPALTRSAGRTARDRSTRSKYRVAFELLTRRISASSALADEGQWKCASCSTITSSLCKSEA